MIKIVGKSITREWVYCYHCHRNMVWGRGYTMPNRGVYLLVCAKCVKKNEKELRAFDKAFMEKGETNNKPKRSN